MFRHLKFTHKIVLMPSLATAAFLLILVFTQMGRNADQDVMTQIENEYFPALELSRDLETVLANIQRSLQDAVAADDVEAIEKTDAIRDVFLDRLRGGKATIHSVSEFEDLEKKFTGYYAIARETSLKMIRKEKGVSLIELLERMQESYKQVRGQLEGLTARWKKEMGEAFNAARANQKQAARAFAFIFLVVFACILLLGALSFVVIRSVKNQVEQAMKVTDRMAEGDLTGRIAMEVRDEIGQIGEAINRAIDRMGGTVKAISVSSDVLSQSSENLVSVSQQMSGNAEQTASQADVVSSTAEEVSRSLQSVSTAVEEMNASIKEIAQNAREAAQVGTQAVNLAEGTHVTIGKLGESSTQIGDVIKVITTIAQQTNLLSLNAAIEAARAGEAGKGFVVVANEVKDLAKKTARATEEIGQKIESIQADTKEAVAAINQIREIIGQMNGIQTSIAGSVEQQTVTTNGISHSVSEAAKGSSEIAENILGMANAAKGTSSGAANTKKSAEDLAKMATQLKEIIGRFRYE
ncbi:MAG: methyl-accepting chemotaxis protein [Candidatus Manganitrophaceae bacterium]|nr:MAG: methyl-accepting chemotaxis protein [Candidatus Manganitrophaceae bacterium]